MRKQYQITAMSTGFSFKCPKNQQRIIKMSSFFGNSLRTKLTKFTSSTKNAANKVMSGIKHKGNVVDIPDEMYCFLSENMID